MTKNYVLVATVLAAVGVAVIGFCSCCILALPYFGLLVLDCMQALVGRGGICT